MHHGQNKGEANKT